MDPAPDKAGQGSEEKKPPRSESHALSWFLWLFAVVFIVYPLSVGPAVAIYPSAPKPVQKFFEIVYEPLERMMDKSKPLQEVLNAYVRFWRTDD